MKTEIIELSLRLCLENKATFPEHIKAISEAEVSSYLVDLVRSIVTYYGKDEQYQIKLPCKFEPKSIFSAKGVQEAIETIRRGDISYPDFLERITSLGVTQYEVDIQAKKTTYSGRNGENHVEPFLKPVITT
jgi:uncharacterized protein YbcV (DUF1398 family)